MEEARGDAGIAAARERIDVVCANGAISFDGDVVEVFGFTYDFSARALTATLKRVELKGSRLTFYSFGNATAIVASLDDDEATSPEMAGLLEAIRAAAPNLET